jgi:hypothetical protein
MKFFQLPLSNAEINRAGKLLAEWGPYTDEQREDAFYKVAGFRATHAYPLRIVRTILRQRAISTDLTATVYGRSKRIISIVAKLERNKNMKLTQMQDIGGCRAIVGDIKGVNDLVSQFRAMSSRLEDIEEYNYLEKPKEDGYRSIHFVVRYRSRHPELEHIPSRRIEIQIRSRLQHQWATALETIDLFTRQTLKIGGGTPNWKRFFALASSLFAMREACPCVPQTSPDRGDVITEITDLWRYLRVQERLNQWMTVITTGIPQEHGTNTMYLIETDVDKMTTGVKLYPAERIADAYSDYSAAERNNQTDSSKSAVLVSASSVDELRLGYPSYYGDAQVFLREIEKELCGVG